ncbi:ATP-dependent DNA helicase DinG [Malikia sp.]|uniref:ATP-dependent DNA helicase DinG n=1 Tax=Malikia sp. TaxID=2070706 RepID=UPI002605EC53|nr:ATP-dependent DNA helicase DinG [Malikia sp.]MDD2729023.1 ATP-dependent DNA helicase DinG [Malikia sp.]
MSKVEMARAALQVFDEVVAGIGLRARAGQRLMAEQVAQTFSEADLGKPPEDEDGPIEALEPQRSIAVIQAGTGVGKSLAYSVPAIALALARNTRVMISTATVALQEQLVAKDLPALANSLPQPFRFALAKGRGRYVCKLKLDRWAQGADAGDGDAAWDAEDDLFAEEARPTSAGRSLSLAQEQVERQTFYQDLQRQLDRGRWDGDRDQLEQPPEGAWWAAVAAEGSSCTARHCPAYDQCSYYAARKSLIGAQVIVVNHDLLLSSLGSRMLPELDNCLLVLDEAHHLPGIALDQFASSMDLSRLKWIDKLASQAVRTGGQLAVSEVAGIPQIAARLRQLMQELARLVMHHHGSALRGEDTPAWGGRRAAPAGTGQASQSGRYRVPRGQLHPELIEPLAQLSLQAQEFLDALRAVSQALKAEIKAQPDEARRLSQQYAQLGTLAPRLEAVASTTQLLLQEPDEGTAPSAKWFTLVTQGDYLVLQAHASPTLPGATLRHQLWNAVRGAVLTSATLTSLGRFDFFLKEVGLFGDPCTLALEVQSPFDFARQGRLVLVDDLPDPKEVTAYNAAMVQALLRDLKRVEHGALVLFTSRAQLRLAEESLPDELREIVLAQTALPRWQLLSRHRERVAAGQPSVIFGMQSFGEGLDLPGQLCEDLFITKLPFAPPDDPVGESRAEWLRQVGRDPFTELVVPATAIRLAQWVGRAIRTEEDEAHVTCYDRRLTRTSYGQRLLQGLPPFTRVTPAELARGG